MAKVSLISEKAMNNLLKDLPPVQRAVESEADDYASVARSYLASYVREGQSSIEVDHSGVDSEVSLVDPEGGALAIEFGWTTPEGKFVPGHYIVSWGLI